MIFAKEDVKNFKIVAISGWRKISEANALFQRIIELTGKVNPTVAYVATGGKDREVKIPEDVKGAFLKVGAKPITKSVLVTKQAQKEIQKVLESADIIFCGGGDLKFLMDNWQKTGIWQDILSAGRRGAVLCGCSTGAMCWSKIGFDDYAKHLQIVFGRRFPFVNIRQGFEFIPAIGIMPFGICPHYETNFWSKFDKFADRTSVPFFALENNTAICLNNGHYEILKSVPNAKAYLFDNEKGIKKMEVVGNIDKFLSYK